MGLLLSVLIVCVGVFEALDCYYHFRAGLLPAARPAAHGAPASGWRQHLTNLNERWRRRPSAALTCGGPGGPGGPGGGGGGPEPSATPLGDALSKNAASQLQEGPGRTPSPPRPTDQLNGAGPPPRWLNNHAEEDTLGNGRGEASPTEESPRVPEIDAPTIVGDAGDDSARARPAIRTGDQNSKRRLSSSLDRPVTITSGDGGDVALLDPLADEPRRLSESFPELEDLPPPPKQLLRVEVDEPRRLSEIDADVPSPLPDPDADLPRRLSQPGEAPLLPPAGPTPAHTASPLPAPAPASARPPVPHPPSRRPRTSSGRTLSPADDEDRLRRISDFTDSEPSSPTRKGSNVDISWPIFHPAHAHPAHKSTLYRLEDVMSVDVEDDVFLPNPPKNPPGGNIIPVHHNLLEESQRMAQAEPKATEGRNINQQKSEQSKESTAPNSEQYKELTDFLKFLDDHIQEDDCMNLWQSIQHSDCRKPQIDSREPPAIENPSKQYLELQEFLKLNYGAGEGPAGPVQGEGPGEPLDESDAADIQKLVAPVLKSAPTDREYMDLLNFWFLLRAQEESPDEPLLEEYFTLKRQDEFKVVDDPSAAPVPANKFQEYEDLQRLLRALPPPPGPATDPHAAAPAPERSGAAARPSLLRPPGDDEPSSECADLPPKSPLHTELVTVSEEPQHLQRPARSHSFEEAPLSDLTENLIKAALEASAGRDDEGEDAEVAAITGRSEQGLEQDPVKDPRGEAGANGHGPAQRPEHASVAPAEAKSGDTAAPGTSGTSQPVHHASSSSQSDQQPEAFWLIFSGEYTKAMSKDWHAGHFCCWQCDESLTGQRYVLRDEHPYCIKCYESVFANTCEECSKTIGIDSKDLSYKDKHWHEACFLCSKCRVSLVDKQFGSKADHIYCGNCYDAQFASRCDGCGEIFRAGTKKMEYKTRQWHEKCFCCCVCKSAIGTKSFIPREQEIYCATCYEEKFATRCVKCNKIITSGGVTYKNEPWHRECFTCTNCNTSLAGQRFTSRDEKPYCADCFGELFAKRCTSCTKPITGIGGTRFISFEDRHWHNDCFICASCKTSLVGRGFITDADDIICPECAKQKLM